LSWRELLKAAEELGVDAAAVTEARREHALARSHDSKREIGVSRTFEFAMTDEQASLVTGSFPPLAGTQTVLGRAIQYRSVFRSVPCRVTLLRLPRRSVVSINFERKDAQSLQYVSYVVAGASIVVVVACFVTGSFVAGLASMVFGGIALAIAGGVGQGMRESLIARARGALLDLEARMRVASDASYFEESTRPR
jgi:hypothetical protein